MVSSVQTLVEFLQQTFVGEQEETTQGTHGDAFTVEKISKILNLEHPMQKQVEGNFGFKLGSLQRFFAFDNHTIEGLPQIINKYAQLLSQGKVYNYQKVFSKYEITIGLPTATGFPLVYTLNTPVYLGIKGKVQAQIPEMRSTQGKYQIPKTLGATTNVEVTYSEDKQGQLTFVTPYDHQVYVAGYKKKVHVSVPVKGSLSVDVQKRHVEVEVKPVQKGGDYKVLHYSTVPYTTVKDVTDFKPVVQGSNTKVVEVKPVKQVTKHLGGKVLGMVYRLEAKTGKRNVDMKKLIYDLFQRHDATSVTVYPTVETSIDYTTVDLYYDAKLSTVQSLGLTATYRRVTPKESGHQTENVFTPTPDSQTRVKKFYQQVSNGIKGAVVDVVDLGLKVQGQTPGEYTLTLACGRSPIDAPTKVLGYFHKTVGSENYEVCFEQSIKDTYVSLVDFEKAVQSVPKTEVTAELKFGDKCETGAKVLVQGKLERTQERREYVQTLPQVEKCRTEMQQGIIFSSNCRNATYQAGLMDKYRFTVKYHGVPEPVKNVTYQVYSLLRHIGYPYVTENLVTEGTPKGEVELDVNFSPDLKTTTVYVSSPLGVAEFRDVHVNQCVRNVAVVHPVQTISQRLQWNKFKQQYNGRSFLFIKTKKKRDYK